MQEEVENRSITLIINAAKLTARLLKEAIRKYLADQKARKSRASPAKDTLHHGKQTVKQLVGQGKGVTNIEITDSNIKSFERVARKYGVDYAVKKDASEQSPKYLVFFKAPDNDAMTAAFKEYLGKTIKREKKPSIIEQLNRFTELLKDTVRGKAKHRAKEQSL